MLIIEQELAFKEKDRDNLSAIRDTDPALADKLAERSPEVRELFYQSVEEENGVIGDLLADTYLLFATEGEAQDQFLDLLERRTGVRNNAADEVIAADRALLKEQSDAIRASYEADAIAFEQAGDQEAADAARRAGNRLAAINETAGNVVDDGLQFLIDFASDPKNVGSEVVLGLIDGFDKFLRSERAIDDVEALRVAADTFIENYDEADPAKKGEIEGKILGTVLGVGIEVAVGGSVSRVSKLGRGNAPDADASKTPANDNPNGKNEIPENTGNSNPDTNGDGTTPTAANDNVSNINLSQSQIDDILSKPKGERPDPSTYLSQAEIDAHLSEFSGGVVRIVSKSTVDARGSLGPSDGTFVFPKSYIDQVINQSNGNLRSIEQKLGFPNEFLDSSDIVLAEIPNPSGLRIPNGNEAGANKLWVPGGKTSGGIPEAVIDAPNIEEIIFRKIGE